MRVLPLYTMKRVSLRDSSIYPAYLPCLHFLGKHMAGHVNILIILMEYISQIEAMYVFGHRQLITFHLP